MSNLIYLEDPPIYERLKPFLITDKKAIIDYCTQLEKIGFYDTCSIQYHSTFSSPELLALYFKERFDLLLLTRTILMELPQQASSSEKIIDYFKALSLAGVKILLFDEELIFDCLKEDSNYSNKELNIFLCHAVVTAKRIPVLKSLFDSTPNKITDYLAVNAPDRSDFYSLFFKWVRSQKTSKDGLGECLAMIVSFLFCTQPFGKRVIISDDRSMWGNIEMVRRDVFKYYSIQEPAIMTTQTMLSVMYRFDICKDVTVLRELALCTKTSDTEIFNFSYLMEDTNAFLDGKGSADDLIEAILDPGVTRIIY